MRSSRASWPSQKLYDTMTGMQWGKIPDTKGWIVPVEKKY